MHSCQEIEEKLIDLLFDELDGEAAASVRAELSACPRCQAQWCEMSRTLRVVEKVEESLLPQENYWPGYEARLRTRLADAVPVRVKLTSWFEGIRWLPSLPMMATAAALLLVTLSLWWWQSTRVSVDPIANTTPTPSPSSDNVPGQNDKSSSQDQNLASNNQSNDRQSRQDKRNHKRHDLLKDSRRNDVVDVNPTPEEIAYQPANFAELPVQADPARHFEKAQLLLRSFRNANVDEGRQIADLSYERQQSRKLVYDNILLRRDAAAKGNLPVEEVLNDLEPLLLDIANLPDKPTAGEIKAIRERMQKQEMIATLQVYTNVVASLGND